MQLNLTSWSPSVRLDHTVTNVKTRLPSVLLLAGVVACNDLSGLAGTQSLPSGTPNPNVYHTAVGALELYQNALADFQGNQSGGLFSYVIQTGLLTDELQDGALGGPPSASSVNGIDTRKLPEGMTYPGTDRDYRELQAVRNDASEGIGALAAYDSSAPSALRGHLFALQGYAEILLADLFCSGVPLSTLDFQGDYTYHAGDSTSLIFHDAITKFDTALTLSGDSSRIEDLAWVGKGRAWLALGQYDSAATAAAHVDNSFSYQVFNLFPASARSPQGTVTVADSEGLNGKPYISSGDPRTASQVDVTNAFGVPLYWPVKYGGATPGVFPITVADWIEARLIQAEAALHGVATGQGSWLDQLNALRATAITPALPRLSDPGTLDARVDLLFHERAFWLFLTGHRQGDLRRLIRQYGRNQAQVYPTGPYAHSQEFYGSYVEAPIPSEESANPKFHGCLRRGA